jgi:hypothetical protein
MSSQLIAFQDAFHFAGLSLSLRTRRNNFTVGANDWIACQAPPSAPNLLVVMLEASIAMTASGAAAITVGSTILDEWFSQLEVSPQAATAARIFLKTRKGAEEFERLVLDSSQSKAGDAAATPFITGPTTHLGSYSRSAQAAFGGAGSRTDTSELWVAIGGSAATLRLTIAPVSSAWQSNVTVNSYTIGFFEVYSVYTGTVAAFENQTATLASGNNQDIMALNVYPAGLATDIVSIVTQTTTNITAVYITDATGGFIVNMDDTQSINAQPFVYPRFSTALPSYSAIILYLHKTVPTSFRLSLANSVALDFLWLGCSGPSAVSIDVAAATPAPDETQRTGTPVPSSTGGQPSAGSTSAGAPGGVAAPKAGARAGTGTAAQWR